MDDDSPPGTPVPRAGLGTAAASGLLRDPDAARPHEVFTVPLAGGWAVGQWQLSPKLGQEGQWFACFWNGDRTWTAMDGVFPADVPERTAAFSSPEAAELALRSRGYLGAFLRARPVRSVMWCR